MLYVCWGFPPCRGSGVYRGLATANSLAALGCDVTVITADRETFLRNTGIDATLEDLVDPRIEIVRVPFEWPENDHEIDAWPLERARDPRGWLAQWNEAAFAEFPEIRYGAWRPGIVAAADEVHARRPVDLVIATANPNVDCAVGLHLHERHGVPYVVDQRDAWSINVLTEERFLPGTPTAEMERTLIESSLESWFVNEPIRAWHAEAYPQAADKLHVVMNGYDLATAPAPRLRASDDAAPLTVGYVGTITPQVPLAEAIEGWIEARETDPRVARARMELYGNLGHSGRAGSVEAALLRSAAVHEVHYGGSLGKATVRDAYETFDVLLFLAGGGKYVTSGKIFEYMATALPIISCHVPEVAAADVLRDYPLWFPVQDLAPDAVAAAISRACEAAVTADEATRRACVEHAARYERETQLRPALERVIEAATAARAGGVR